MHFVAKTVGFVDSWDAVCSNTIPQPAMLSAFGPGRKHSIAPRFGYKQHTVLFA